MEPEIEQVIIDILGKYSWAFIVLAFGIFFRSIPENLVKGFIVFWDSGLQKDHIIFYKGKKARVVRKGIMKTVIYIQDTNGKGATKIVITNSELKSSDLEIPIDQDYDKRD